MPGWLSQLSIWLQLRSWSLSLWVQAPLGALSWQLRVWNLLQILCLPLSLSLPHSCCLSLSLSLSNMNKHWWGAWVAQSVGRPTSAQVMISGFMSLSFVSGSVLTAWSLEFASDSMSLLSLCPSPVHALSLSVPKINKRWKKKLKKVSFYLLYWQQHLAEPE